MPVEDIYAGGVSKTRNPKIQNMLRMIGYGENIGSGFPKILKAWNDAGWKTPILENKLDIDEICLTLPLVDEKSREKSREKIIAAIQQTPSITQKKLSAMLQLSVKTIEKQLKNLREEGIIRRVGPDKGGHWEVVKGD